jgi:DNA invertase Pin-like site-specific DNA recombinase
MRCAKTKHRFDLIMAWSVNCLGRSPRDLVTFLSEMNALKVDLYLHQQGIDAQRCRNGHVPDVGHFCSVRTRHAADPGRRCRDGRARVAGRRAEPDRLRVCARQQIQNAT